MEAGNLYTFDTTILFCVCSYREGSIFTDFIVKTTEVKTAELAKANKEFSEAVNSNIAPVIGSVIAVYNSKSNIASRSLHFV